VLEESLRMPDAKDLVAMRISVTGTQNGLDTLHSFHLLDYYDEKKNVTAMGRTTAYTASAILQLLARKEITEKGVVPPEKLGMNERLFKQIMVELERDGIKITKSTYPPLT
jgi:lysine 6-dehydrogenase